MENTVPYSVRIYKYIVRCYDSWYVRRGKRVRAHWSADDEIVVVGVPSACVISWKTLPIENISGALYVPRRQHKPVAVALPLFLPSESYINQQLGRVTPSVNATRVTPYNAPVAIAEQLYVTSLLFSTVLLIRFLLSESKTILFTNAAWPIDRCFFLFHGSSAFNMDFQE